MTYDKGVNYSYALLLKLTVWIKTSMKRGLGYIGVHDVGQSRLGGVQLTMQHWVLVSVPCVVVSFPDDPFQEEITIS